MPQPKSLNLSFDPIERAAQNWRVHFGPSSAMAAVTSIMRAQQILLSQLDTLLKPYDLTFARYEALVLLTFSKSGSLPLSKIGERLMVHPTSVTNTVDRLERAGLVRRMRNPRDGRGVLAEITDRGREIVRVATADLMGAEFGLGMYGEAQLQEMFDMLRTIRIAAGDFPGEAGDPAGAGAGGRAGEPGV
ncbi:MarR family winged helix-turn-helix transcriptional regulator [Sinosporangium siamense]|uniref:MarR family transcriptional regulator n=1 Tax=Sinosporangium siamense TaxID=1367973 RepID=A0A919VAN5_9ACTN|nr:MarR family transcriptional regulator [Sinosporangium siamense]GII91294.1 MarR family transcriptional regulator [Sinosporangium siamense]